MNKNMPGSMKPRNSYPAEQGVEQESQEMGTEVGVFDIGAHPELKGSQPGDPIKGSWEGTVESVEGNTVKVKYNEVNLETKNPADREMEDLMNRGNASMGKGANEEEDEY